MPYSLILAQNDSLLTNLGVAGRTAAVREGVSSLVAGIVADAFNELAGENLSPGVESVALPPEVSPSLPADLAVVVVAWWTPERAPHFQAIFDRIKAKLQEIDPLAEIEVLPNTVGAPDGQGRHRRPGIIDLTAAEAKVPL